MRHRKRTIKLGRKTEHREAMLASLVCHLITHQRIRTTVEKAKAARRLAEKMVTLGKRGTLADRRRAISRLRRPECVKPLFEAIAPAFKDRPGGYTRIVRLGQRGGDNSEMCFLEWVNYIPKAPKKKKKPAAEGKPAPAATKKEARKPKKAEESTAAKTKA